MFGKRTAGEVLLRLTYKAYVEDEEDEGVKMESTSGYMSDEDVLDYAQSDVSSGGNFVVGKERETFMDLLAALLVSEEFQGIVSSETGSSRGPEQGEEASRATAGSTVTGATKAESVSNSSTGEQVLSSSLHDYLGKNCLLYILIWLLALLWLFRYFSNLACGDNKCDGARLLQPR